LIRNKFNACGHAGRMQGPATPEAFRSLAAADRLVGLVEGLTAVEHTRGEVGGDGQYRAGIAEALL
jgi:hypothetical protein